MIYPSAYTEKYRYWGNRVWVSVHIVPRGYVKMSDKKEWKEWKEKENTLLYHIIVFSLGYLRYLPLGTSPDIRIFIFHRNLRKPSISKCFGSYISSCCILLLSINVISGVMSHTPRRILLIMLIASFRVSSFSCLLKIVEM